MTDCPMNGPKAPETCPTCGRARGDGCAIAETGPWPDTSPREAKPVSDPARSALAAFVSACGGNPPDWLREEHAAAENALATPPADVGALLAEALAYESEAFEEQEEVDGGDLVEWFAEWRERVKSAALAEHPHTAALRRVRGLATWHSGKAKGEIYRLATEALGGEASEACRYSPWAALEAAEYWLKEEAASEHPGQTKPDDILRVIGHALAGRPAPAPSPDLADVLARAESFVQGFEDDEMQEGIADLLRDLKAAREKAEG